MIWLSFFLGAYRSFLMKPLKYPRYELRFLTFTIWSFRS